MIMKLAVDIGSKFQTSLGKDRTLGDLTTAILNNALVVAGVYMIFLFVSAGLAIIKGAGESKPESIAKGQKTLTTALLGFAIIFGAYWIVQILGILTGSRGSLIP